MRTTVLSNTMRFRQVNIRCCTFHHAKTVVTQVTGDFVQPCRKSAAMIILLQMKPNPDERFLYDVLCLFFAAKQPECNPKNKRLADCYQLPKCSHIVLFASFNEGFNFFLIHASKIFILYHDTL